jgi:type I restriction enzyme, R subunit
MVRGAGLCGRARAQLAPGEPAAERDSFGEVVLVGRLREAIRRLNFSIPEEAREDALRKVLRVGTPSIIQTNRAFHQMLRDGVDVEYPRGDGSIKGDKVLLVDFTDVRANDFFAVNQFTVIEGQHYRRPDIVVFVSGLPLGLIELKNAADEDATIWRFCCAGSSSANVSSICCTISSPSRKTRTPARSTRSSLATISSTR